MWRNKRKSIRRSTAGLKSIASLGKRLIQLDRQLIKHGMRVVSPQDADIEICEGKILGVRITVCFME